MRSLTYIFFWYARSSDFSSMYQSCHTEAIVFGDRKSMLRIWAQWFSNLLMTLSFDWIALLFGLFNVGAIVYSWLVYKREYNVAHVRESYTTTCKACIVWTQTYLQKLYIMYHLLFLMLFYTPKACIIELDQILPHERIWVNPSCGFGLSFVQC